MRMSSLFWYDCFVKFSMHRLTFSGRMVGIRTLTGGCPVSRGGSPTLRKTSFMRCRYVWFSCTCR